MNDEVNISLNSKAFAEAVRPELERYKREFKEYLKSGIFVIDQINAYLARTRGKAIRPIITFLSAKLVGQVSDSTIKAALIVELLHNATLVHDDIVDESDLRRGFPSIKKIWNNKIAVLYGDYLLAHSLMAMLEMRDLAVFDILSVTAKRLSKGELLQAAKTRKLDMNEETYLRMIADKTAALISASAELGALSAGGDENQRRALKEYGENLGMAFQIRDDLLDYIGRKGVLGKPTGGDIREKKITLPLIYGLRKAPDSKKREILHAIKRRKQLKKVVEFVRSGDGIEYAENQAGKFAGEAANRLAVFPDGDEKRLLQELADFVVTREK